MITWLVILYVAIGVLRVGYDFFRPDYNQPLYISQRMWHRIIFYCLLWPYLLVSSGDIHYLKLWLI